MWERSRLRLYTCTQILNLYICQKIIDKSVGQYYTISVLTTIVNIYDS